MEKIEVQHIKLSQIVESKTNPRHDFNEVKLNELAGSIKEKGVKVPILIRPLDKGFELVDGARRFRASKLAGILEIPSIVEAMTDEAALELQIITNLQREDLSPMEEAESYESLIKGQFKYTPERIHEKIGKSLGYVKQRLRLISLTKEVRDALYAGKIQFGHALIIARIEGDDVQKKALEIAHQKCSNATISVAELKKKITEDLFIPLSSAPFKLSDDLLLPVAGACTACPFNTGVTTELFDDIKKGGMCTKTSCFKEKTNAFYEQVKEAETAKGNNVLSVQECEDAFSRYGGLSYSSKFILSSDKCDEHPKKLPYNKILKDKIKEYIGIDPKHKIYRLYKKTEIAVALKDEKWAKKLTEKKRSTSYSSKPDPRAKRRRELEEQLKTKKIMDTLLTRKFDQKLFHKILLEHIDHNADDLCHALSLPVSHKGSYQIQRKVNLATLEAHYAKQSAENKQRLDFIFIALTDTPVEALMKEFKLDPKKIKLEAKKVEAAEFQEKKKNASKPKKGKVAKAAAEPEDTDEEEELDEE